MTRRWEVLVCGLILVASIASALAVGTSAATGLLGQFWPNPEWAGAPVTEQLSSLPDIAHFIRGVPRVASTGGSAEWTGVLFVDQPGESSSRDEKPDGRLRASRYRRGRDGRHERPGLRQPRLTAVRGDCRQREVAQIGAALAAIPLSVGGSPHAPRRPCGRGDVCSLVTWRCSGIAALLPRGPSCNTTSSSAVPASRHGPISTRSTPRWSCTGGADASER